jgi:hypothetical protein
VKALAIALSVMLLGCSFVVPDYRWRSRGEKYVVKPLVFLHLGSASQVCANRSGIAEITVFVNLYNLPAQEVRFVFNEKVEVRMFGKDLTLVLHRVRIGEHSVVVTTAGYHDVSLSFSVWDCGA